MVKFINRITGTDMWVAEDRVNEYKAAGYKLAAELEKPIEAIMPTAEPEPIIEKPKKTATKKPTGKKK